MEPSTVTIILQGKTYSLKLSDPESIRKIPGAERRQLISVLKEIEIQDKLAENAIRAATEKTSAPTHAKDVASNVIADRQEARPERLGAGDVDELMARLIMEERKNQKPPLTPKTFYKWMVIILLVIVALIYIF